MALSTTLVSLISRPKVALVPVMLSLRQPVNKYRLKCVFLLDLADSFTKKTLAGVGYGIGVTRSIYNWSNFNTFTLFHE